MDSRFEMCFEIEADEPKIHYRCMSLDDLRYMRNFYAGQARGKFGTYAQACKWQHEQYAKLVAYLEAK